MKFLESEDIIIACSTSTTSNAAIAVIRISGFKDIKLFQKFFSINLSYINPRNVYFTQLLSNSELIDSICITFFQAPASYNGENILELSVHGNLLNVEKVMEIFTAENFCRLANPGEFTFRALRNKKLTLSQVEGLDLLLNANSNYALSQGNSLLHGDLSSLYLELLEKFKVHKSTLELLIDFSDDVGDEQAVKLFNTSLNDFLKIISQLNTRCENSTLNLSEPSIALFGLPNAGKSTIFNFLLNQERSIVSSIAGTTRDYISENYKVGGVLYRLIDTAGLRNSDDQIEVEGVKRALSQLDKTFFKILVVNPLDDYAQLQSLLDVSFDLIVFTHTDVDSFDVSIKNFKIYFPGPMGAELNFVRTSFKSSLDSLVNKKYLQETSHNPILLDRHKSIISNAYSLAINYQSLVLSENDMGILSSELNSMGDCISELIGIVSPDELLNNIFQNFCIGK